MHYILYFLDNQHALMNKAHIIPDLIKLTLFRIVKKELNMYTCL